MIFTIAIVITPQRLYLRNRIALVGEEIGYKEKWTSLIF